MPTFAASRSQNQCLKKRTSIATTTATSAKAYKALTAGLLMTHTFQAQEPSVSRFPKRE
jgi:hypothetical protein